MEKYNINDIHIQQILPKLANDLICKNHYSGTVAKGVVYHLGIFVEHRLLGVAQFGYGIRPKDTCKWVDGTQSGEYLELNRLWIDDELGANAESKSISLCLKWVKKHNPKLKWIISFADGMMGKVGTIYQATNFVYTGYRTDSNGIWLTKEGERLHNISLWHKYKKLGGNTGRAYLETIYGKPLYCVVGGQFRYFYFYDRKLIKKLRKGTNILPYPKEDDIRNHLRIKDKYNDTEDHWDKFVELLNKPKVEIKHKVNDFFE
jgi:adenine modification enzyme